MVTSASTVAPTIAAARDVGDVLLTWTHNAANVGGYQVWYSADFHFTPGEDCDAPPVGMACAADIAHNHAYLLLGVNAAGQRSDPSNRVGEFGFGLTPGMP